MSNANEVIGYTEQNTSSVDLVNKIKRTCKELAHQIRMRKFLFEDEDWLLNDFEKEQILEVTKCLCNNILEYLDEIENPQESQKIFYEITKKAMQELIEFTDKFFKVNTYIKRDSNANLEYIRKITDVEMWACRTVFNPQTPFDSKDLLKFFKVNPHIKLPQ